MHRQSQLGRAGALTLAAGSLTILLAAAPASAVCVGDCNGDGTVAINELITGVNIALDARPVADCPSFACTGTGMVPINCLIQGVNNALGMCPAGDTPTMTPVESTPTATVTTPPAVNTPTATETPTVMETQTATPTVTPTTITCPLDAGRYTITQLEGGQLQVSSIDGGTPGGFPFPTGGTVVQDVGPGDANCVHQTVVPASGGFSSPVFCIPGLNFTVQVTQNGCGIGQIDSDGGSDYTVTEVGDTSDSSATCSLPAVGCPPGPPSTMLADRDSSLRVDITVGNGSADTCPGGGTANAIVVIPVRTLTWLASDFSCPDADGVFNGTDTRILLVNQNLDFTTDVTTSRWSDIDGDGCSIAGAGPAAGFSRTGVCMDLVGKTVTTAATGTIGSNGSPLFDLTFATRLPNALSGPTASGGATCDTPPIVNFTGTATRCIQ